jgi:DnaJ-domain-containing protein 1
MGLQELILLMLVIAVLSLTGLWPRIIRGLQELRGEVPPEAPQPTAEDLDVCYKLLGVSSSANWTEIERAYHRKAKIHHPDRGGDEDTMRALNDAYRKLKQLRR